MANCSQGPQKKVPFSWLLLSTLSFSKPSQDNEIFTNSRTEPKEEIFSEAVAFAFSLLVLCFCFALLLLCFCAANDTSLSLMLDGLNKSLINIARPKLCCCSKDKPWRKGRIRGHRPYSVQPLVAHSWCPFADSPKKKWRCRGYLCINELGDTQDGFWANF